MILIRAALFAVFAFMGTLSLSAQSWLPSGPAIVVITNELDQLNEPPMPNPAGGSLMNKQQYNDLYSKSGCSDCVLASVKKQFLLLTGIRIKEGMDTGTAVAEVRALMISGANNNAALLSNIQLAYLYMQDILS